MTEENKPSTDSFDDFMDTYLKADHLKKAPLKAFVNSVDAITDDKGKNRLICNVQAEGGKYKWDVNVTNMRSLKDLGVSAPKNLINHNVIFEKVRVQNPQTNKFVDSLHVIKVE